MKSVLRRSWMFAAGIGAVAALLLVFGGGVTTTLADANSNDHYVDVDPGTPGIQTVITQPIGVPFNVDIVIDQDDDDGSGNPANAGGYQFKMSTDKAVVNITGGAPLATFCTLPSVCAPAGPVIQNVGGGSDPGAAPLFDRATIFAGETIVAGPNSANEGAVYQVELECIAPGTSSLDLRPAPPDGLGQSTSMLGSTADGPDVTHDAGVTNSPDDPGIICEPQADLRVLKTHAPANPVAGTDVTYTITVWNDGPNPAYAVALTDGLAENKTYVSDDSPYGCAPAPSPPAPPNTYACPITNPADPMDTMAPSTMVTFDIVAHIEYADTGKLNDNTVVVQSIDPATFTPVTTDPNIGPAGVILGDPEFTDCLLARLADPNPIDPAADVCDNVWLDQVQVEPADVSIEKEADASVYSEGDTITWTITATSNGPSDASTVVLSDTVGVNQSISAAYLDAATDASYNCVETGDGTADIVGSTATCTLDGILPVSSSAVMIVETTVTGSDGNQCTDTADVEWADPLSASTGPVTVACFPPTVRMQKDLTDNPLDVVDTGNLWLCKDCPPIGDPGFVQGEGALLVNEDVFNVANDPDGAGAFEFQVKFDHKVFDIEVNETDWLSNGGTRDVDCSMTIVTENWILFGCVSTGDIPGQTADGVLATLSVLPEPDMVYRLTPGQQNGKFEVILDENCEIADVWGDPLMLQDAQGNDIGLAPGIVTGGIVEECGDLFVTVRILEGDLNLDCAVDVLDQQAIASRYGAFWGMLAYDEWYDLEPPLKDFDIDIKDLQKVFGRDGSTCQNPLPDQDPLEPPADP